MNHNSKDQPSYYAIVPANVRYDKRLSANQKLLYGEITALCNKTGECWASNKYFAELYEVSNTSISLVFFSHLPIFCYVSTYKCSEQTVYLLLTTRKRFSFL